MEIGKPEKIHEIQLDPHEAPRPHKPEPAPAREPEPVHTPEPEKVPAGV